jgi:acylphosphatase
MKRVRLIVSGLVQGVGFRHHTRREASELGVTGWARNHADGSVEIEAQGNEVALKRFIEWANRGAPASRVENVVAEDIPSKEHETGFEIRF